jgi:hypothetical protein
VKPAIPWDYAKLLDIQLYWFIYLAKNNVDS